MIDKRRLSTNLLLSLVQSLWLAIAYFLLYRFLLRQLGPKQMGVWSLVLAITSAANVANLGVGSSVVRLTAKLRAQSDSEAIARLLSTALLVVAGLYTAAGFLIFWLAPLGLEHLVEKEHLESALTILPYSIICLILNGISTCVLLPFMDGIQRNSLRSLLLMFSVGVLLVGSIVLVPEYGLVGVAYSQVIQSFLLLLFSLAVVCWIQGRSMFPPRSADKYLFKQILSFGVREQVISLAQLCCDPVTKSFVVRFGDLSFVAYFEIASRMVIQARSVLVGANQVLMPVFTEASERNDGSITALYSKNMSLLYSVSLVWMAMLASGAFVVSRLLFGSLNIVFVFSTLVLSCASVVNILSSPAYFANMGLGKLGNNVLGNIAIAVLNVVCGGLFGMLFGGYGSVLGWACALSLGSALIMYTYHTSNGISIWAVISRESRLNGILAFLYALGISFTYAHFNLGLWQMIYIGLPPFIGFVMLPFIRNPEVASTLGYLRRRAWV